MPDIQDMIGREVEVIAGGVRYSGTLVEISDTEVHLKGLLQWVALPASSVSVIKLRGSVEREPERMGQSQEEGESLKSNADAKGASRP